jgi:hypothetical protein
MEGEWRRLLMGLVRQAIDVAHFRRDLDVDQFVWELCAIYLGHHIAQRFLRSKDADARAMSAFEALIDRVKALRKRKSADGSTFRSRTRQKRGHARR